MKLQLCKDVYHCTPSQLDAEPIGTILLHLEMLRMEQEADQARRGVSVTRKRGDLSKRKKKV